MISESFVSVVTDLASSTGVKMAKLDPAGLQKTALSVMRKRLPTQSRAVVAGLKSPEKRRFIVAPPRYQQHAGANVQASLRTIFDTLQPSILHSHGETAPKLLQLSSLEAAILKERFPQLLVEADVQYELTRTPIPLDVEPIQVPAAGGKTLSIEVSGAQGAPVPEARVLLFTDYTTRAGYEGTTDLNGRLKITIRTSETLFERVIVLPKGGFWSRVWKDRAASSLLRLEIPSLTIQGFDWGHLATECDKRGSRYGKDVKIAIVDSGIGPHGSLKVAGGKNFILNESADDWEDHNGHGTHCAGVIAALEAAASTWGYAPKVEVYALRVFGGPDGGGYAYDIADAIDWAVQAGCDVVSLSLGSDKPSGYIRNSLEKANDAGVLCVAAVGNDGGPVQYPAKFRNVVGVSAVGRVDTFPEDSIHQEAKSTVYSSDGEFFFASFSNRGDEVDVCAPGVAVTSTVPGDVYSPWDGTSMACPHVAGIAALLLEAAPDIRNAPRDGLRAGTLMDRLQGLCVDLGMPRIYQGAGLPRLGKLFAP